MLVACAVCAAPAVLAQIPGVWKPVGPLVIDKGLAGVAAGRVDRVWYSADGELVYALTGYGREYQSADLDRWTTADVLPPSVNSMSVGGSSPEPQVQYRVSPNDPAVLYALGQAVYRSRDGGIHWDNLTSYRGRSLVGDGLRDLAVSPRNADELIVGGDDGIFRSMDGGLSWMSLNGGFPNFPSIRLLNVPEGAKGLRVALDSIRAAGLPPGEKRAWLPSTADDLQAETAQKLLLERTFGVAVTATAVAGDFIYAGTDEPEIKVSADRGSTWRNGSVPGSSLVERFWIDPVDPRIALVVLGQNLDQRASQSRVLRTSNGGIFWDDITANLADVDVHGVTFDRTSGAAYAATDAGVYAARIGLSLPGMSSNWTLVSGLPVAPVMDVKLDAQANQLWADLQGLGIYVTVAPHRTDDPRLVSAADWVGRAVAPGELLTLLGDRAESVRAGDTEFPILGTSGSETQIQVPFDFAPRLVSIQVQSRDHARTLAAAPVIPAVPAIFVDPDGSPMILDAENGVMLNADHPALRGAHIQILAAGLGQVTPPWPAGIAAPVDNQPKVNGTVHAYLDRTPVEVTRAVLAPGYVGMYLVEVAVPVSLNPGPAELFIDVDGAPSNRVRVYIEP
jgi:uncharacterized protein (TIGR03437 family)